MCLAAAGIVWAVAGSAHAAAITEYFNDYGTVQANINGLGSATGGWSGAWAHSLSCYYEPGINGAYNQTGYSNAGNQTGTNDGCAAHHTSTYVGSRGFDQTMGNDCWMSVLMTFSNNTYAATSFILNPWSDMNWPGDGNSDGCFGLDRIDGQAKAWFAYGAGGARSTIASTDTHADGTWHLFVARLEVNYDANQNDRLAVWIDPAELTSGAAGLGTPVFLGQGQDCISPLSRVGLNCGNTSYIDSIRISDSGLNAVLVPEPSTLTLLGLAALLMLLRRRLKLF